MIVVSVVSLVLDLADVLVVVEVVVEVEVLVVVAGVFPLDKVTKFDKK